MFDIDNWQEIFATMQKNKLRTFLTAFGVFWGIFMLVLLLGAGQGMQNGIQSEFGRFAVNSVWVWAQRTSMPYAGLRPGREISFRDDDLRAIRQEAEGINLLSPRNWLTGEFTLTYKNKNGSFSVMGVGTDYFGVDMIDLIDGRVFNRNDEADHRKVAILGKRAKEILFGDKEALGEYINIKGGYFKVIGYFKKEGNNGRFEERVFIPFATYQAVFNPQRDVQVMTMTAKDGIEAKQLEAKIRQVLARRHRFDVKDEQAIGIENNEEEWKRFQGLFAAIKLFVGVIGTLTLIAGAVGVSNIMLIIVKERTREIGIRKAIGATPWSIVSQIILESVFITSFSGYLGLLAGVGLLAGISYAIDSSGAKLPYFTRPEVDFGVALAATAVLVIAGAIAGLVPAIKAASIKPIEALRAD